MKQADFDGLAQQWRLPLTRAAYHLCGDREAAYDLVQETLLDAYQSIEKLREPEKLGAWLYAILRRKAVRYRRQRPQELELPEQLAAPDDTQTATAEILCEQMVKLPQAERELLAGKYLLGLSYQELAESLSVSEGTVRVRCFRAKERLRQLMEEAGLNTSGTNPRPNLSTDSQKEVR
ncbi:MAG: RNA polymerase sigma factor [Armatimonadota bacterium]